MVRGESKRNIILRVMLIFSIVGLSVTSYQTYEHYFLGTSVCDFTATFSCSVVTESRFGEFPPSSGIATAAWGILWWSVLAILVYGTLRKKEWLKLQEFYIFLWLIGGLIFAIYLLSIELYFLPQETGEIVICPLCTFQHILIVANLVLSLSILKKSIKDYLEDIFYIKK
ncbi:MAG: hypothetical protein HYW24_03640 [Candidatus Aenigmarchaeota archaeon]|nr:hypothetical protein [Candidatus Aenigmarchaeota archaeon]